MLPYCSSHRGRRSALSPTSHLLSEDLNQAPHHTVIYHHLFPTLICIVSFPFRSKDPGQTRGAQSLPILTAIKVSSQTAVRCCADRSIPGESLSPPLPPMLGLPEMLGSIPPNPPQQLLVLAGKLQAAAFAALSPEGALGQS